MYLSNQRMETGESNSDRQNYSSDSRRCDTAAGQAQPTAWRLLSLPPELRTRIYEVVHLTRTHDFSLSPGLTQVCSVTRAETLPIFYGRTKFLIDRLDDDEGTTQLDMAKAWLLAVACHVPLIKDISIIPFAGGSAKLALKSSNGELQCEFDTGVSCLSTKYDEMDAKFWKQVGYQQCIDAVLHLHQPNGVFTAALLIWVVELLAVLEDF